MYDKWWILTSHLLKSPPFFCYFGLCSSKFRHISCTGGERALTASLMHSFFLPVAPNILKCHSTAKFSTSRITCKFCPIHTICHANSLLKDFDEKPNAFCAVFDWYYLVMTVSWTQNSEVFAKFGVNFIHKSHVKNTIILVKTFTISILTITHFNTCNK